MGAQVFSHLSSDLRRSGIVPRILIVLTFLLLLPLPTATAEPGARLLDLGWTTQDGAVKIVAHLDRPVRFRATTTGGRLIVDLWPIVDPEPRWPAAHAGGRPPAGRRASPTTRCAYAPVGDGATPTWCLSIWPIRRSRSCRSWGRELSPATSLLRPRRPAPTRWSRSTAGSSPSVPGTLWGCSSSTGNCSPRPPDGDRY